MASGLCDQEPTGVFWPASGVPAQMCERHLDGQVRLGAQRARQEGPPMVIDTRP